MTFEQFEKRVCDLFGYSVEKGIAQTNRGLENYTSYIKKDKDNTLQLRIDNDPFCTMQICYDAEIYMPVMEQLYCREISQMVILYITVTVLSLSKQ